MVAQIDRDYLRTSPFKASTRILSYALFEGRPLTTKGRWINAVVFALLGLERRLPAPRRVEQPVFVIGTGRSGTTILGVVLSMHRQVGFLNEPKAVWHAACKSEDLVGSYTREPANYRLSGADATDDVRKAMHRMYGWYLASTLSRRVVDKYLELVFRVPFVRAIFPDARFLFLVRNGWDTCRSIEHWSERLGVEEADECHDWWGVDNRKWNLLVEQVAAGDPDFGPVIDRVRRLERQVDMAALEWILTMREGMRLRERYPDAVLTVNYERLASDPVATLEEIGRFCGLERDERFLAYAGRVLKPARPVAPFELDAVLAEPFRRTMRELGYDSN